jgi:hypothetical protein
MCSLRKNISLSSIVPIKVSLAETSIKMPLQCVTLCNVEYPCSFAKSVHFTSYLFQSRTTSFLVLLYAYLLLSVQSFAKNAGLYGERVGALHVIGVDNAAADRIRSQVSVLQRSEISNPPSHGARIVSVTSQHFSTYLVIVSIID